MHRKKRKQTWIRYCAGIVVLIILGVNMLEAATAASISTTYEIGSGSSVYQYSDLIHNYKIFGISYSRNTLNYEIKYYDGELATENYGTTYTQYIDLIEKRAQLQGLKDTYLEYRATTTDAAVLAEVDSEISSIDSQIVQYDASISSYRSTLAEANLQDDIAQFYINNKVMLQFEAQNKMMNEFMKQCYSLILITEKQRYYNEYQEYLTLVQKIENIKYNRGLIDQVTLEKAEVNILKNNLQIEEYKDAYYLSYIDMKSETKINDNARILLPISINKKVYNLEQTIAQFENRNTSLLQLKHLKHCYLDYFNSNSGSYMLQKQVELRIKDYQLQHDELVIDIEDYVTDAVSSYNKSFLSLESTEKEVQLANSNYSKTMLKKQHKRATELDVCKAKYEVAAAQVAYYQSLYDIIIWQNIIDNNIYGVTP